MLSSREAQDDINLCTHVPQYQHKRARSSSPVKSRRPVQDWTSLARSDGSLHNLFSTTSMTHDQLVELSSSEVSQRLHISKADYSIPIPFQIQFPPRLSKSKSESASEGLDCPRGSSKFIFTGHTYEPIAPETPMKPEANQIKPSTTPSTPIKPPSVMSSRKKVSAYLKSTHEDHFDQLSIIEEQSTNGYSRASSKSSKKALSVPLTESNSINTTPINKHRAQTSRDIRDIRDMNHPNTEQELSQTKDSHNSPFMSSSRKTSSSIFSAYVGDFAGLVSEKDQSEPDASKSNVTKETLFTKKTGVTAIAYEEPPHNLSAPGIPHTAAFQHNLCVENLTQLNPDKRVFSEVSQVSSVSSFGPSGDVLNFDHAYMSSPNAKGEVQVSKYLSSCMNEFDFKESPSRTTSEEMKSPLHAHGLQNGFPALSPERFTESNHSEPKKDYAQENSVKVDIADLKITAKPQASMGYASGSSHSQIDSGTAPLIIQVKGPENEPPSEKNDDNFGAGVGFHFPNNTSNATNSSEARRSRSQMISERRPPRRNFFSDGQIEIPDLEDVSILQKEYSKSGKLSYESDINTWGVYSKAATKTKFGEVPFDSDSESSFNSQFSKLTTKSTDMKSPPTKPLATKNSAASPVNHSRHRSMYNIDFDYQSITSPTRNHHSRSKSNAFVDTLASSFTNKNVARTAGQGGQAAFKFGGETKPHSFPNRTSNGIEYGLEKSKMIVNEPPKRVSYAVDFKAERPAPEPFSRNSPRGASPHYYSNFKSLPHSRSGLSTNMTRLGSESASSYQTSQSGRYTESTAPSENITIDLTREKYDICMVNKNNSISSYRSTIEEMKDGKNVEVIFVEEEEEEIPKELSEDSEDRDDLSSIYSHYMSNWGERNRLRKNSSILSPKAGYNRNFSGLSGISETTSASEISWAGSSEKNFMVKSPASVSREQAYMKFPNNLHSRSPSLGLRSKVPTGKSKMRSDQDSHYFDYSESECYDFKSYMFQQQVQR